MRKDDEARCSQFQSRGDCLRHYLVSPLDEELRIAMPHNICLITEDDAIQLLMHGVLPECSRDGHRHVSREDARLMSLGAEHVPWLDDAYVRTGEISEP